MSYILDALRKSQQARSPAQPPHRGAVHNLSLSFPANGVWAIFAIVLIFGIVAGAYFLWRGLPAEAPDSIPVSSTPETIPASPEPKDVVAVPVVHEPPKKKSAPVEDLAEQAKLPDPIETPKPVPARSEKKATAKPARDTVMAPVTTAEAAPMVTDDVPLLQHMPQEFQRALPPLAVTIHVYSMDEASRILFVNNREYRPGSRIEGDIQVLAIVPDGAVLSYRGERFKLSRPR